MRHTIIKEGVAYPSGYYIEGGALKWTVYDEDLEKEVPRKILVIFNSFFNDDIVGEASDLKRERDGSITAEIEITNPIWTNEDFKFCGFSTYVSPTEGPWENNVIDEGEILGVLVYWHGANPVQIQERPEF